MSFWTEQRIGDLTRMVADGMSSGQIAAAMGVTRGAAMGKIDRLGLHLWNAKRLKLTAAAIAATRNANKRARRAAANAGATHNPELDLTEAERRAAVEQRRIAFTCEVVDLSAEQRATAKPLLALGLNDCRWPYGDPAKPDFICCGAPQHPGRPYCRTHVGAAYQIMEVV